MSEPAFSSPDDRLQRSINHLSLEALSELTPREVESNIDEAAGSSDEVWWEGLRELAVGRMQDSRLRQETRLHWARVAVRAIHGKWENADVDRNVPLAEEAHVSAYAIREFGQVHGEDLRDASVLCHRVVENLGDSRDEVARATAHWRDLDRVDMLRLRRIKNVLRPLEGLGDLLEEDDPVRVRLNAWLGLLPDLP